MTVIDERAGHETRRTPEGDGWYLHCPTYSERRLVRSEWACDCGEWRISNQGEIWGWTPNEELDEKLASRREILAAWRAGDYDRAKALKAAAAA